MGNKIFDHSYVVADIFILDLTPGFNELGKEKTTARRDEKHLSFEIWSALY